MSPLQQPSISQSWTLKVQLIQPAYHLKQISVILIAACEIDIIAQRRGS